MHCLWHACVMCTSGARWAVGGRAWGVGERRRTHKGASKTEGESALTRACARARKGKERGGQERERRGEERRNTISMKMKRMTMMTRCCDVARFGSSRARYAHEAAIASTRAKREHAGVRVRETTGNCRGCCRGHCHCRCRRRVAGVVVVSTPRRRGSRAPPPRQIPITTAPRCALRDAAERDATALRCRQHGPRFLFARAKCANLYQHLEDQTGEMRLS